MQPSLENIALWALILAYVGTFVMRNLLVKARIRQPVRSRDGLVTVTIICVAACFLVVLLSARESFYLRMGPIGFMRNPLVAVGGYGLFLASIMGAWIVSAQMGRSWRIGVHEDQRTELIVTGVYAYIRNPYFVCYFAIFTSILMIRPSLVLLGLTLFTGFLFHRMVLKEERYLLGKHGKAYEAYRRRTGRYLPGV